jgi:chromosome segregation ATPase
MNLFKSKISETETSLVKLQEQFDSLNETFATTQKELVEASQLSNTYKEEFERVEAENKELQSKLESLNQEIAEVSKDALEVEDLASLKAVELLSETGHPQVEVLEDEVTEQMDFDVISKFKELKGQELQNFYNQNKQAISAALKNGR